MPSGPMSIFKKKRPSLNGSRSSSWSMGERFKSNPVEDFTVEELGGKSGHLVYGPVSVFNGEFAIGRWFLEDIGLTHIIGKVALTVKSRLPNVTVSVTFRGLTEYNGRTLAFLNFTQDILTGGNNGHEVLNNSRLIYFTRPRTWPKGIPLCVEISTCQRPSHVPRALY